MRKMMFVLGVLATGQTPTPADAADKPIAEGTRWEGRRFFARDDPKKDMGQKWSFTVDSLDKAGKFKGKMVLGDGKNAREYEIKGTISGKKIIFQSEKKGSFEQKFNGDWAGGEITFTWGGTTDKATQASGKAKASIGGK